MICDKDVYLSIPRIVRRLCSKCGVVHTVPTGKKCKQPRELFAMDLADENTQDENNDRSSTPNTVQGTVNRIVSPIVAPLASSEIEQTVAGTSEVGVCSNSPPSAALGVSDKLDHLARAVSAINTRLGVIGTEVQDLKTKSLKQAAVVDPVTLHDHKRNPVLVEQAKARQQMVQTATSSGQGTAQGVNPNNNILLDAQHHGSNFKSIDQFNQIHGRVLNNDFPSNFMYNNTQNANTNIKIGSRESR